MQQEGVAFGIANSCGEETMMLEMHTKLGTAFIAAVALLTLVMALVG